LGGSPGAQDNMAMMSWRDKLPFRRRGVDGFGRIFQESKHDRPQVREAIDKLARQVTGGEKSEFSPLAHVAGKVEHAVAGFGRATGHYVANHAEEIGLSAGAAAAVGGVAAYVVDVVGGVGAVAALF
jgi:hypothetical protein